MSPQEQAREDLEHFKLNQKEYDVRKESLNDQLKDHGESFESISNKLNDSSILEKLLKNLEINPKVFLTDASDQKIKDDLKKRTEEAFCKGVFGTPSFVVNNKLFWGQDRLEFAISEANK